MDAPIAWYKTGLFALIEERADRPVRSSRPERATASFEEIYRDHYQDVYRYVLLRTGRPDEAEDIVADSFDRAFSAWRSGNGPAGRALPWLIVIARRIIVDRWRRGRLIRWLPLAVGVDRTEPVDPDDPRARAEIWHWLDRLAQALPARQREALLLRYHRDLSDEEIGEVLGLSASGVRTLVSRALMAIRQHPELWS